jgi:glycosyltransferase involved in cell wall biosynthesis
MSESVNHQTGWPWSEEATARPEFYGELPRISIVTPSYNQGKFIEETIRSVLLQNYPKLEYIVIDGGSTDNSIEVIRKYADRISFWISEKDRGQSHAINKGLAQCSGNIFNWINSDDLLMPGALWAVAEKWLERPGCIVAGHTEYFEEAMTFAVSKASGQTLRNFVRFWETDDFGWAQQGTFVPLQALKETGGVREDLRYCLDYHMMVKLLARGVDVTYVDRVLARFRLHDTSKTIGSKAAFRLERVPMLRSLKDLAIEVEDWEWDRQQARRLVDVAVNVARSGRLLPGLRLFGEALQLSPVGTAGEFVHRLRERFSA